MRTILEYRNSAYHMNHRFCSDQFFFVYWRIESKKNNSYIGRYSIWYWSFPILIRLFFLELLLITILLTRTVVTWSSWNEQKKSCCIITACQLGYLALAGHPMKYGMMIILLYEKKVALWWEIVSIKSRLHFICFVFILRRKYVVSNSNQQKNNVSENLSLDISDCFLFDFYGA